jgi:chromosome partitioning protein
MHTAFANLKGGAGKTTSAVSMADALSSHGHILLLDLDPQGTLSAWTAERTEAARELLIGDFSPAEHVVSVREGLDVIPANRSLERATEKRASKLAARLEKLWSAISGYDQVLIDTPPQAGELVTAALLSVDNVFCPVAPGRGAVDGLVHLMDYTRRIGGADLEVAFACNVDLRSKLHKQVPNDLVDKLGEKACNHFVRSTVQIQEAETASELPSSYCPGATAWEDYQALTAEIYGLAADVEGTSV